MTAALSTKRSNVGKYSKTTIGQLTYQLDLRFGISRYERRAYQGIVWGAQEVVYDNQIAVQPVAARFTLSRQLRSDINPYGLLIDGFNFIEYRRPVPDGSRPNSGPANRAATNL